MHKEWQSKPRKVIGVMTGNSLDAIDLALVNIYHESKLETLSTYSVPFSSDYKTLVSDIFSNNSANNSIAILDIYHSELIASTILEFIDKNNINKSDIDAIANHGQTVFHNPEKKDYYGLDFGYTLQLGNGSYLSQKIELPVVSDFRTADLAVGGEGAPLVPIFDEKIFRNKKENIICLNIGGIANISFLPKNSKEIIAFDTGPGNSLIDIATNKYYNLDYDKNGEIAYSGKIIYELFNELKNHNYINKVPPKSTGKEEFGIEYFNSLHLNNYKPQDIIRTLSEFTAWSIAENIKLFACENSIIYPSGGGSRNNYINHRINYYLPKSSLKSTLEKGIDPQFKEAICFAYLGWRTIAGLPSNLKSVTGANKEIILGSISY